MKFRLLKFFLPILLLSGVVYAQDSTKKKTKFAAIPIINYNRTQDAMVGGMSNAYFKMNKEDTISPSSSVGLAGMYTSEKSYFLFAFGQLYLDEDKWRIRAGGGVANINFQFYYQDPIAVGGEGFVDYTTKAKVAGLQLQRKVYRRIYAGVIGAYNSSTTTFKLPSNLGGDSTSTNSLNNVGYILSNDTRNNVNYPVRGMFLNFKNQFYQNWVGSDHDFTEFTFNYNQFFPLDKNGKHLLVSRLFFDVSTGDVPFEGQAVVGGDDIRGYSQGKYRGNQVYAAQAEYRWNFYKRFGMVGFFGLASAVENFSDIFDSQVLPGIGAGLRFQMIKSEKVNIGIDGAFGKDDWSLTFRIGESFAR